LTSFEILYKNLQDHSSFVTNFTEFFKEKATKYKATVDFSSKDDVLKWVGSLVTKMESDNKWLIDQVSQKDSLGNFVFELVHFKRSLTLAFRFSLRYYKLYN